MKLKQLETVQASLQEFKAFCDSPCAAEPCSITQYDIDSLQRQISYVWDWIAKHQEGHLPALVSTEQLQRALKLLGLDKEYNVQPKTIYASDGSGAKEEQFIIAKKK